MTEPLSEHVDASIPLVEDMEREYGSNFEGMSEADKLYLIEGLAFGSGKIPRGLSDQIMQLSMSERIIALEKAHVFALIKKLANSL